MSNIYLVTTQEQLFENDLYKIIGVEESLRLLEPLKIVGLDTETDSLDCHTGKLLLLQLGCIDFQIVIDCTTIDIRKYKSYLESDRLFLFWNARFDLKWLFNYKIVPKRVWDGYLGEKLLWLGYPTKLSPEVWEKIKEPRYTYVPEDKENKKKPYYIIYMNLKKAGEMYLGVELDKTIRGQIIWRGIDPKVIEYAALDVKYLESIRNEQNKKLKEVGLLTAMDYECKFIIPLAYLEYCGVKVDTDKWKQKMNKDNAELDAVITKMNQWLIENDPKSKYIYINYQGDLFAENSFDLSPKVNINWNSGKQVIPIFKKFGVDVEVEADGENKDSINEKVLAPQKDKCGLIPLYIEYKGLMKLVSTYGQNLLDQINPHTGRLYTNFNPIGTDTAKTCSNICLISIGKLTELYYIYTNIYKDSSCFLLRKYEKFWPLVEKFTSKYSVNSVKGRENHKTEPSLSNKEGAETRNGEPK